MSDAAANARETLPQLLARLGEGDFGTITADTPAAGDHLLFGDASDNGKLNRIAISADVAGLIAAANKAAIADAAGLGVGDDVDFAAATVSSLTSTGNATIGDGSGTGVGTLYINRSTVPRIAFQVAGVTTAYIDSNADDTIRFVDSAAASVLARINATDFLCNVDGNFGSNTLTAGEAVLGGTGGYTFGDAGNNNYVGLELTTGANIWLEMASNSGIKGYVGFDSGGAFEVYNSGPTQLLNISPAGDMTLSAGGSLTAGAVSFNGGDLFDDYDEGTFTPSFQGATVAGTFTYTAQVGRYIKTGNSVDISLHVKLSAITVAATGNLNIPGLPFTSKNTANSGWVNTAFAANFGSIATDPQAFLNVNFAILNLFKQNTNGAFSRYVGSDLTATTDLCLTMNYEAA